MIQHCLFHWDMIKHTIKAGLHSILSSLEIFPHVFLITNIHIHMHINTCTSLVWKMCCFRLVYDSLSYYLGNFLSGNEDHESIVFQDVVLISTINAKHPSVLVSAFGQIPVWLRPCHASSCHNCNCPGC